MEFPRLRYLQAGGSPEEVDELERQFDELPPSTQLSALHRLAGVDQTQLLEDLEQLRGGAHVDEETDPTPDASADVDVDRGRAALEPRTGALLGTLEPPAGREPLGEDDEEDEDLDEDEDDDEDDRGR